MGFPDVPSVLGCCVWPEPTAGALGSHTGEKSTLAERGVMGIWKCNCLPQKRDQAMGPLVGILMILRTKNATCLKFGHRYLCKKISIFVA